MLKNILGILLLLALSPGASPSQAAQKHSYDAFYNSSEEFRRLDGRLNEIYKDLMGKLSWAEKRVLRDEQRKWHDKLFPNFVERDFAAAPEENAMAALRGRVEGLEKLARAGKAESIMGMPLSFGMSKEETAEKLGVSSMSMLDAGAGGDGAYKIKLFGQTLPVNFKFMTTVFSPWDDDKTKKSFGMFVQTLQRDFGARLEDGPGQSRALTTLVDVGVEGTDSREDYTILNEELAKKYKRAYPQYAPMAALLEDEGLFSPYDPDYSDSASDPTDYYEDRERYIIASGSWGTLDGGFSVNYVSKLYLDLHIPSVNALLQHLSQISAYNDSLVIFPTRASIVDVVYGIGGGDVTYSQGAGEYRYLDREYNNAGKSMSARACLSPENKAIAATISYVEGDYPGFEEQLIKRLEKKYKKLKQTPDAVMEFLEHGSNFDLDFETENNYIHIGDTPHFAVQHELTIINKRALGGYSSAYAKSRETAREEEEKRREETRKDSEKF